MIMLKCFTGILISFLLLIPSNEIDQPVVEPFPKVKDGWGRPVFYNTLNNQCENKVGWDVSCPARMKPIIDKPE